MCYKIGIPEGVCELKFIKRWLIFLYIMVIPLNIRYGLNHVFGFIEWLIIDAKFRFGVMFGSLLTIIIFELFKG